MKTFTKLSIAAALALSATAASADNTGWYAGASASFNKIDLGLADLNNRVLQVQVGNRFHENFAIEARLGTGVGDDSMSGNGQTLKIETDHSASLYAKAIIPLDAVELYALAGVNRSKFTATYSGVINGRDSGNDSDFAYGIGASFSASDEVAIFAEYNNLMDKDGVKITGFTLGANYAF